MKIIKDKTNTIPEKDTLAGHIYANANAFQTDRYFIYMRTDCATRVVLANCHGGSAFVGNIESLSDERVIVFPDASLVLYPGKTV